jgi:hypothetical protein
LLLESDAVVFPATVEQVVEVLSQPDQAFAADPHWNGPRRYQILGRFFGGCRSDAHPNTFTTAR